MDGLKISVLSDLIGWYTNKRIVISFGGPNIVDQQKFPFLFCYTYQLSVKVIDKKVLE